MHSKKALKVGLFGGTFNPIHFGHINLALEIKEKKGLDAVWFMPTNQSPLRTDEKSLEAIHRKKMVELAIEGIEGFELCDSELKREAPSYTIDTINELISAYPQHTFYLLLGEDALLRFSEWKNHEEIVEKIPLLIAKRSTSDTFCKKINLSEKLKSVLQSALIETKQLDISATDIRERLRKRLYCGHLLPGKVLDYISVNQLYYNIGP